jgi:hypothetical protein
LVPNTLWWQQECRLARGFPKLWADNGIHSRRPATTFQVRTESGEPSRQPEVREGLATTVPVSQVGIAYVGTRIQEEAMVLKCIVPMVMAASLLAGSAAMADAYRPDEFLTLDLQKAVLSPKPLGPEAHFEPVAVEARSDHAVAVVPAATQPDVPRTVATARVRVAKSIAKPVATARGAARTRLAHRRGNPLDAQAMDTRSQPHIQTWPCKPGSGGICAWK